MTYPYKDRSYISITTVFQIDDPDASTPSYVYGRMNTGSSVEEDGANVYSTGDGCLTASF
jgi:hypothetical protein